MKPLELMRKRPAWVVPTLAGLVIAGALVYQQRLLEQMAESVRHSSTASQIQTLDERVTALEQFKDAELQRPEAVTLEQVSELKAVLEARLSELDTQLADRAQISDLQVLRDVVASLGISMQKLEAEKTTQRPSNVHQPRSSLRSRPSTCTASKYVAGNALSPACPTNRNESATAWRLWHRRTVQDQRCL